MSDTIILNEKRDVTLTPYIVTDKKSPTVLIAPGGGYATCTVTEGEPVAKAYNVHGFNAFVLCYSVGKNYKWPYPMDDFNAAMQYIVHNAETYKVDTKYIIAAGFSAGGHLVSYAASKAKIKPYAAVICYGATKQSCIEYNAPGAPDAVSAINLSTCPCFLVSSRNDWIVPIENTTDFIAALNKNFIDYESHTYGYAMHGFSIGKAVGAVGPMFCDRVGDWLDESVSWLRELIESRYISIKESAEYNDKHSEVLSCHNSCGAIFKNKKAVEYIQKNLAQVYFIYQQTKQQVGDYVDRVTLKNVFEFIEMDF